MQTDGKINRIANIKNKQTEKRYKEITIRQRYKQTGRRKLEKGTDRHKN